VGLDPDLRDFCQRQNIPVVIDVDFSSSEDPDSSEEINEPSDLKVYSIFLKKAQKVGLESQSQCKVTFRKIYPEGFWTTWHCHKKFRADLASKGFLPLDEFLK
jgi:hypothetical protein